MAIRPTARGMRLEQLFWTIIKGEDQIKNANDAKNFLEACNNLCNFKKSTYCVEVLISRPKGVEAVSTAVRSNLTVNYILSATLPFLRSLSEPEVQTLNDGAFLRQILAAVLDPPTFWSALLEAFNANHLDTPGVEVFAWLCLQIASSRLPELETQLVDVQSIVKTECLLKSESHQARVLAHRIKKIINTFSQVTSGSDGSTPGGRHDNDFADFRQISIYPTTDEFLSTEPPFLERLDDVFEKPVEVSAQANLDRLFRLLREDMLGELREDLNVAMGKKKARRVPLCLSDLSFAGIDFGDPGRIKNCVLRVACGQGITFPKNVPRDKRKRFLDDNKNFMKHNSFGALCSGTKIIAFGSLVRNVNDLLREPPVVGIEFVDSPGLKDTLAALLGPGANEVKFYAVDTAVFAYEPVLKRLQTITEMPLERNLVDPTHVSDGFEVPERLGILLHHMESFLAEKREFTIPTRLGQNKTIKIRDAQLKSLINGLDNEVAQIQGPPGTGKSFIGALIVLLFLNYTDYRVLILSYTNHALDQFIEDLIHIGVKSTDIVRLGSKGTQATEQTRLEHYVKGNKYRLTYEQRSIINQLKYRASEIKDRLLELSQNLQAKHIRPRDILEFLESQLSENYYIYWEAFQVPVVDDGFQFVGQDGRALTAEDMYWSWLHPRSVNMMGALAASLDPASFSVWQIPDSEKMKLHAHWCESVRNEQVAEFAQLSQQLNEHRKEIDSIFDESKRQVLKNKRVIACTTTAAAMYQSIIKTAEPDVVMEEEAGEILEPHLLTALSPSVKRIIMIGDHKQLRPKVNNYSLTIEKGDGYDLNVSLFERLIRQGYPFTTLQEQHRSHPDISHFARMLTYGDLKDVPSTSTRASIKGLLSRVVFVHHEHPEEELSNVGEKRDPTSKGSKRNLYEAQMVLKMVKYLGQQGYRTENMVVLTPYLGQLSLLKETLRHENDPVLNDLDSHELVMAGLMKEAEAKVNKKPLRLSTIDNYQGEESDIVIASLTRSNASGDIGFLYARERLVVLMSRARNGIILFGNMLTLTKSKKGGELWTEYFGIMKERGHLFDGVPVYCERHPKRSAVLKKPKDFDLQCPEGGCVEICGAILSCGKHKCKRRCHFFEDHSQAPCQEKVETTCERGHKTRVPCGKTDQGCKECFREDEDTRRRAKRDIDLEMKRQERQAEYARKLQEIEDEIDHNKRMMKYEQEKVDEAATLKAKQEQLKTLKETKQRMDHIQVQDTLRKARENGTQQPDNNQGRGTGFHAGVSEATDEWEFLKKEYGAQNDALDELMKLIGLEAVKEQFLATINVVDAKLRQGVSLADERFSCSLLGNPGTGKTTVARIWAKFLTTIGAIAGSTFEETTGSKLASDGVKGCEQLLEKIKNEGGGVLFIDEAYQLSSGNSSGGKAVLDYLLTEVENLRGKVVFVLAGYNKQMESFFAHNPGFPSRFPIEMKFDDYSDEELLSILRLQLHKKAPQMKVEGGEDGLFFRIASRRVGRGRGTEGFGNARAIENALAQILQRQVKRFSRERRKKQPTDALLLTQEDIIGPEPSGTVSNSKAYKKLLDLIGLDKVKENLQVMVDTLQTNYERELAEEPIVEFSLNRVFLGGPGTGKTTVAKLYGEVLVDLGLLSKGEVITKNPSDFVGAHLGQSEAQTKGILASAMGKVLVIDEAYGLHVESSNGNNMFQVAVIDTIVAEVQSVPGEDRCVLLLGYREQMEEMFQKVNPGLSRRFPLSSAFVFENFDDDALAKILELKLKQSGFKITDEGRKVALEVLRRARNRPNFGNAGEIDILLGRAKESNQKRRSAGKTKRRGVLEAIDFDEDFDRADRSDTDIEKLFEGDIGREKVVALLKGYQDLVRRFRSLDMDPEIPFNFLFRGPPGTGKTSTARKMGKVYYDMGFLASTDVIECSATDMIGQYIGHTGPKVQALLDKALGRVLVIDEAYRLGEGHFAKEAVDELVDCVTKPKYQAKLIIILAGYVEDINSLLQINPGMSSRFPEVVDFESLNPAACIKLLRSQLESKKKLLAEKGKILDLSCLLPSQTAFISLLEDKMRDLTQQSGWANARDVKELAKMIFNSLEFSSERVLVTEKVITTQLDKMSDERQNRAANTKAKHFARQSEVIFDQLINRPPPPSIQTNNSTQVSQQEKTEDSEEITTEEPIKPEIPALDPSLRDAGVSDEVWNQLVADKEEENRKEAEFQKLKDAYQKARDEDREKIIRQVVAEEKRRKEEAKKKAKLRQMGACPMGYDWIKQIGGYRCAGGSHWMADADVDRL